jgi:hypothetical protein
MTTRPAGQSRAQFKSIPGFSDQREMPRIAKLRLGIRDKKGTSSEHPRETDHFVLDVADSVAPDAATEIRERFVELYGERPQILTNVRAVSNDREAVFSSAYEWWRAGKLFCHGNGDAALRKIDGEWHEWTPAQPCANTGCPDFGSKKCGLQSRLRIMLPGVSIAGFFQIDTGSIYSAANIRNGLNMIDALTTQLFGEPRITAIPLILARAPQKIEFDGKLNEHFILHLTPQNYTYDSLRAIAESGNRLALAAGTPAPTIPDEEDDMPEEQVPEAEQHEEPPFDPNAEDEIVAAAPLLRWNDGTLAAKRAQFPVQSDLLAHVREQIDRAIDATLAALAMPVGDVDALRKEMSSKQELLRALIARWQALPPAARKARRSA